MFSIYACNIYFSTDIPATSAGLAQVRRLFKRAVTVNKYHSASWVAWAKFEQRAGNMGEGEGRCVCVCLCVYEFVFVIVMGLNNFLYNIYIIFI